MAQLSKQNLLWEELSWEEIASLRSKAHGMAILPVGATEQHGAHLPTGVDTMSVWAVASGVSAATGVPLLPVLSYGCSLGHSAKWPGTLSLRPETLSRMVVDIAEWLALCGFDRLLILNGHVTNWAPLRCALETIRHERPAMRIALRSIWEISPEIGQRYHADARNFHANCAETSLMLALRPDLVQTDKCVDEADHSTGHFFSYRVDQESVSGVVGKPEQARAQDGQALLQLCIRELSAQVQRAMQENTPLETAGLV